MIIIKDALNRIDIIIKDGSEKKSLLLKTLREWNEEIDPNIDISHWKTTHITRCSRCHRIFASRTDKKYCSKECQYNQKGENKK